MIIPISRIRFAKTAARFRKELIEKYGEEGAKDRIFVTTDKARGTLKQFSDKAGYETFVVPDDIGGRYSVLTAVGLLPIACAGIDIDELIKIIPAPDYPTKGLLMGRAAIRKSICKYLYIVVDNSVVADIRMLFDRLRSCKV